MNDRAQGGRSLPDDVVASGVSPEFDAGNLPAALQHEHRTAAGVYGRLNVLVGNLDFVRRTADGDAVETLSAGDRHVILPEEVHRVELGPNARFRIEFFRSKHA